jgi:hypothetical protein
MEIGDKRFLKVVRTAIRKADTGWVLEDYPAQAAAVVRRVQKEGYGFVPKLPTRRLIRASANALRQGTTERLAVAIRVYSAYMQAAAIEPMGTSGSWEEFIREVSAAIKKADTRRFFENYRFQAVAATARMMQLGVMIAPLTVKPEHLRKGEAAVPDGVAWNDTVAERVVYLMIYAR